HVEERVVDRLEGGLDSKLGYFVLLSVFHEDMHDEAFTYTRQTLGYPPPTLSTKWEPEGGGPLPGDVEVPGDTFLLGAAPDEPLVIDNEKWVHPVEMKPFAIAKSALTQAEFAAFAEAGGYRRPEFWNASGWKWRQSVDAEHPVYWQRDGNNWLRRD